MNSEKVKKNNERRKEGNNEAIKCKHRIGKMKEKLEHKKIKEKEKYIQIIKII